MKRRIRQQIRQQLAAMDEMVRYTRSLAACKRLTSQGEFTEADVIMLFLAMPDEVQTVAAALSAWQMGKTVVVPKVSWEHLRMQPVEIKGLDTEMTVTQHGLTEPVEGQPVPVEMIDLVVVPALAFDRSGHRLGRGAGFFDRFLSQPDCRALSCGLAFHEQLVDTLPIEPHDHPVDMLVTDEEVIRFGR